MVRFLIMDLGSSSVRVLLYDEHGVPVPGLLARRAHQFSHGPGGAVTTDFGALAALMEECLDHALAHPQVTGVDAVGMAVLAGSLVGMGPNLSALTPVYTYADTQPAADAEALRRETDARAAHQRTGCRIHPAYQPARLRWLARTQPQVFAQVATWHDLSSALYARWFGRPTPISTSAAAWSGLLNRASLTWDAEWLHALGLNADALTEATSWREAQRGLASAFARRWPLLADTPFFLAVGDGAAANLGSGGGAGAPVLTLGTTAALRLITPAPRHPLPGELWEYNVDAGRRLLGGALTEGGSTAAWCRSALGLTTDDLNNALLRPADAHGLTAVPTLAGERSPGWNPSAAGTLHGLRPHTTRLDMAQALLEGVALRLRALAEALGVRGEALLAGGGALDTIPAWAQVIASATDCPLYLLDEREPTARGVAVLLAEALAPGTSVEPPRIRAEIAPQPQVAAAFAAAAERQAALYDALPSR